MTFGTLSAMMFADHVMGEKNPWAELFDTGRTKIKGGLWNYIKENKDYPYYLIRDRFAGKGGHSLRAIPRGSWRSHRDRRTDGGRLPRPRQPDSRPLSHLHAHGLLRALQRGRAHMGLPVSRIAIQSERRRAGGTCRKTARADRTEAEGQRSQPDRNQGFGIRDWGLGQHRVIRTRPESLIPNP